MVSVWSTVHSHSTKNPVLIPRVGGNTPHDQFVDANVPEAKEGYWYTNKFLHYDGNFQTIKAGGDYDKEYPVWYGRRTFKMLDGAQISIDYLTDISKNAPANWTEDVKYVPDPDTPRLPKRTRIFRPEEVAKLDDVEETRPLLIALHGLTGGSHESYLRSVLCEVQKQLVSTNKDIEMAVITSRGCNRSKITTPQMFNGAWTEDLRTFIKHVTKVQPHRSIFVTGYSLGACILANYLGQEGTSIAPQIKAAILVSNPWDMIISSIELSKSWMGAYAYIPTMAQNLCRVVRNNRNVLQQSPLYGNIAEKTKNIKTIYDFDNTFTGPVFGFAGAYDYYRAASSVTRLHNINVPTLVLHAEDDPICPSSVIPYLESSENPYIHLVTTTQGGHLGWFQNNGERWHSIVSAKYLRAFLTESDLSLQAEDKSYTGKRWFRDGKFQMDYDKSS